MLLIKNGYMIDPASGCQGEYDILIRDKKIVKIVEKGQGLQVLKELQCKGTDGAADAVNDTAADCQVIDAAGLIVAPGLVDVHVHFREPGFTHKEDIDTGAKAAARGGFTTVVLMANTKPAVDNPETLEYVIKRGLETTIHVTTCANVTMGLAGKELVDMKALAALGAVGFTDDGIPIMDVELVRKAMEEVAALDMPISFHEEDPAYITNNGINRGKASEFFGIGGSPREAEITLVERDLQIALETGACINIQHISTREAVELVRKARQADLAKQVQGCEESCPNEAPGQQRNIISRIHAEATPHHFTLTEDAAIKYGTLAKMNPPLREEADRLAVIEGLKDGTIDIIATDHAPHTAEEKAKAITDAPSGIIGLETALPLAITSLVKEGHLTLTEVLQKMSTNPAQMYHLNAGYLAEGGPADLILIDENASQVFTEYASKATNTPFTGWELQGVIKKTICDGTVIYEA